VFPAATLFLDVGVQRDLWPEGAWPVVAAGEAEAIATLFAVARELGIRQGGIVCAHAAGEDLGGRPAHAARATAGAGHPDDCLPARPIRLWEPDAPAVPPADRDHADYVTSGCQAPVEAAPVHGRVLDHLAAGVRDAVVFGAVVEDAMAHAVDALLARRVRVHVALDAAATADPERAQRVVAAWKRRFVDGTTVAEIARALRRATGSN
jgi:hypothetical protein